MCSENQDPTTIKITLTGYLRNLECEENSNRQKLPTDA